MILSMFSELVCLVLSGGWSFLTGRFNVQGQHYLRLCAKSLHYHQDCTHHEQIKMLGMVQNCSLIRVNDRLWMQRMYRTLEVATGSRSEKSISRNSVLRPHWGWVDQELADDLSVYHSFRCQGEGGVRGVGEVDGLVYSV